MKEFKRLFLLSLFLVPSILFAQKTIRGVVKGDNGELLPGVGVVEKGTTNGTTTDFDGVYIIELESNDATLAYSFIGYKITEIKIKGNTQNVTLEIDHQQLDEIVVIGYGTIAKKDLTGAVTSLNPDQRNLDVAKSIGDFLTGRAAGVQVNSLGSQPGAPISIKIRGVNSLTSSTEPLYVIDGVIVDSSDEDTINPSGTYEAPQNGIAGINPRDIEDIQILKDASATAIYGSRGSNGVILITTKRGKKGKAKFNFATTTSMGNVTNLYTVLETMDYVDFQNDIKDSQGFIPKYYVYPDDSFAVFENDEQYMIDNSDSIERLEGVNWADEIFQTSVATDMRLSVSGAGENGNYFIAGGVIKSEGNIPDTSSDVIDFVININQNLTKRLKLGTKISTTYTKNSASQGTEGLGSARFNIMKQINSYAPIRNDVENIDGSDVDPDNYIDGPEAWIVGYDDLSNDIRFQGAFNLDFKISKIFSYKFLFGGDYRNKTRQRWFGNELAKGAQVNGEATLATLNRFRYNIDNTITFKKVFNKNNKINGFVGVVIDQRKTVNTANRATGFANHDLRADGISFGEIYSPVIYDKQDEFILSFLGRINYTLMNRYLFSATVRTDGSSKFATGNKYATFPSFAFAWVAKNEGFLEDVESVSQLKLRLSWGLTGNQNIPNYRTITPYGSSNPPLSDGSGGAITSFIPTNLANPDLRWETTSQYDAGLDVSFLNNRFTLTTDIYYKEIEDLLLNVQVGASTGFTSYYANQGSITSKGLEFTVYANIIDKNFKWDVYGNIGLNKSKIQNLGIPLADFGQETYSAFLGSQISGGRYFHVPANIFIEGMAPGLFYGYETDGIINTQEKLDTAPSIGSLAPLMGDVNMVDQNGDGQITSADLTIIGDPNPDFDFGFGTTLYYNAFTLDIFFNGSQGAEIANGNSLQDGYAAQSPKNIREEAYFDAWSPENPDGAFPRVGYNLSDVTGFTDRIVEDASYLRLSNVAFSYQLPTENIKGLTGVNLTLSGQNLFLITNYSGYDPEISSFSFSKGKVGVDWNSFPNQRRVSLGLNLSF